MFNVSTTLTHPECISGDGGRIEQAYFTSFIITLRPYKNNLSLQMSEFAVLSKFLPVKPKLK